MTVSKYLSILRSSWKLIAGCALIGAIIAAVLSFAATPLYKSSTNLFFYISGGDSTQQLLQGSTYAQNQVQSFALLATQPVVLEPVIKDLKLDTTPVALAKQVSTTVPLDTVLLQISVVDTAPNQAAQIANGIGAQLSKTVSAMSPSATSSSNSAVTVKATTVSPATPPPFPFSPQKKMNIALGLFGGLVVGVIWSLIRALLSSRVNTVERVAEITDVPVIGQLPGAPTRDRVELSQATHGPRAEAVSALATNFDYVNVKRRVKSLVVTSSLAEEGKTSTSLSLALALSTNLRVVLIDADLRRPTLAEATGLDGSVGLSTLLAGKATLDDVVQPWQRDRLSVITAGGVPPNPPMLLASELMTDLLAELRDRYDLVIIDAPPLLPVSDAAILGQETSGCLLVVNARSSRRSDVQQSLRTLELAGATPLGIVLNEVKVAEGRAYGSYDVLPEATTEAQG